MLMRWWQQHLLLARYHHIEQQTHEEINRKRFSGINFRSSRKTFPSSQHTLPPINNQAKNGCIYRQPNGLRRLALLMGEVMAKLYSFTSLWLTEHYVLCSRSRVCSVEYRRDGIHLHFIYLYMPSYSYASFISSTNYVNEVISSHVHFAFASAQKLYSGISLNYHFQSNLIGLMSD